MSNKRTISIPATSEDLDLLPEGCTTTELLVDIDLIADDYVRIYTTSRGEVALLTNKLRSLEERPDTKQEAGSAAGSTESSSGSSSPVERLRA